MNAVWRRFERPAGPLREPRTSTPIGTRQDPTRSRASGDGVSNHHRPSTRLADQLVPRGDTHRGHTGVYGSIFSEAAPQQRDGASISWRMCWRWAIGIFLCEEAEEFLTGLGSGRTTSDTVSSRLAAPSSRLAGRVANSIFRLECRLGENSARVLADSPLEFLASLQGHF